jgi:hypothetical protein
MRNPPVRLLEGVGQGIRLICIMDSAGYPVGFVAFLPAHQLSILREGLCG